MQITSLVRTAAIVALLAAGALLAAPARADIPAPAGSGTSTIVEVDSNEFSPSVIRINPGDTVVWKAVKPGHTVTASTHEFDYYPTRYMTTGETVSFRFLVNATVRYYCKPHGDARGVGMAGVIVVGTGDTASTVAK